MLIKRRAIQVIDLQPLGLIPIYQWTIERPYNAQNFASHTPHSDATIITEISLITD